MCLSNTTLTLNVRGTMLAVTQISRGSFVRRLYTKGQGLYTEERLGLQLSSPLTKYCSLRVILTNYIQ